MKRLLFLTLMGISLFSCGQDKSYDNMLDGLLSNSVPSIAADSLYDVYKSPGFILLDTRSREEYEVSHIRGAKFAGYQQFQLSEWEHLAKSDTIYLYCSVGYRSEKIGEKFKKAGYEHVVNIKGGIFSWMNQHYPVVNRAEKKTDSIHGYDKVWSIWLQEGTVVYE